MSNGMAEVVVAVLGTESGASDEAVLRDWALHATGGFAGMVNPDFDDHLASPGDHDAVLSAYGRIRAALPTTGRVFADRGPLLRFAEMELGHPPTEAPSAPAETLDRYLHGVERLLQGSLPDHAPGNNWTLDEILAV